MSQKPIFSFLIFMLHSIHIRSTYNFKKCTDEMNYNYFYIYLQNLKMGENDASGQELQFLHIVAITRRVICVHFQVL
jgi:hypothetical protein